jgi:RNA polymerase sigma-70 factor, ECF subfamily
VSSVAPEENERPGPADVASLEEALVRRAQRGDREALRQLLGQHADALYGRVILPRLGDPTTAEDVLKATMVTAIEKLHSFRWQGRSVYFWLRRIAVNKVIDHHRRNQRAQRLARSLAREPEPEGPGRAGPEAELIASEERRLNAGRVGAALAKLHPRYRRAIELRLLRELPREECARQLEVTLGTFDVVLFRAVNAFRRSFGAP